MNPPRLDLSKTRHDLRTPINHILGYCEMLLEEESMPDRIRTDLEKIYAGGRRLLELIARYFNEETFGSQRDLQQIQHELRTPVNHIIGYSELLREQAAELGLDRLVLDLKRIHAGATNWLALMEEHLIPAAAMTDPNAADQTSGPLIALVTPGITFQTLRPKSAEPSAHWNADILVVDDDADNCELLARRLQRYGARVSTAKNGLEALQLLRRTPFDLVLLDLLMPGLDGYQVLVKLKTDPKLRHLPVIMISGLDQENGIARCLETGAEDYLTKPFNPVFLRARIGACLEKKHWRDQEQQTYQALVKSQQHLAAELAGAGAYVRSLLPAPIDGKVSARWCFHPSAQLGGDAFGYHWLDGDSFAMYLLDVCGHGVGAALLSVSALNTLRAGNLSRADFQEPASVLNEMNRIFAMERQNQMYFTLWYGVFNVATRKLAFASAGHPPALLLQNQPPLTARPLRTSGPPIGSFPQAEYRAAATDVALSSRLALFSDGVYEILKPDGKTQTLAEFTAFLENQARADGLAPDTTLAAMLKLGGTQTLEDDFSLVEFRFG